MLNRRGFLGGAAAISVAVGPSAALAQTIIPGPTGYGAPAGTSPFPPAVFRERRRRLMDKMGGGVAVLFGAASLSNGGPVGGGGRQDSDFAYLTGIHDEAGAAILLAPRERTYKEYLFLASRDPEIERWDGERLALGGDLRGRTGFERVMRSSALNSRLMDLASRAPELHFLGPAQAPPSPPSRALKLYGEVGANLPGTRVVNSRNLIRDMRAVKEPRELELIRRAIAATERGLLAGMAAVRPGMREFELKRIIEAEFAAAGATGIAFPSIVGTGRAGAVAHYSGGDAVLAAGDLVVADVGAEVGRYAADITRTFPVGGRFTPDQRQVYETVLHAQEAAIAQLRPGAYYEDLHATAERVIRQAGYGDYFFHGLGHWVGLDVHDAGDFSQPLPVGGVLTIEPGIYLADRGFGVRIEDDFLITASGHEHLSSRVPRRPEDVEALVGRR